MTRRPVLLNVARHVGMFQLSQRFSSRHLRVLCYHGFSFEDEHLFRPKLFMQAALLAQRMTWLTQHGYGVVSLEEARVRLKEGTLRPKSVVITIDDGFYSVLAIAFPIFKRFGFPVTLYMTTYYCRRANPIFRLVVQYMFWATQKSYLDLGGILPSHTGRVEIDGFEEASVEQKIIEHGETVLTEEERVHLAEELGQRLGVSYDQIRNSRKLTLLTEEEVAQLAKDGLDIQLHTHRHHFPGDLDLAGREIADNRSVLAPLTDRPLNHFCYPSGLWSKEHWPLLKSLDIATATTCELGLVTAETPNLAWPRILDADDLHQTTFEAELTGFKSSIRFLKGMLRPT
jgi:peptidoglycan/xylan/chitin deacetylase (PgdA/CDA1 family)